MYQQADLPRLLTAPDARASIEHALSHLTRSLEGTAAAECGPLLSTLVGSTSSALEQSEAALSASAARKDALLASLRTLLDARREEARALSGVHEALEDKMVDFRDGLHSSIAARQSGEGLTLRESLTQKLEEREQLQRRRDWLAVLARAEAFGEQVKKELKPPLSFARVSKPYAELADYAIEVVGAAPRLELAGHVAQLVQEVWDEVVATFTERANKALEKTDWPKPFAGRVDWSDAALGDFKDAFVGLLKLEAFGRSHTVTLPDAVPAPSEPLLALRPLLRALALRFKWQFDGTRGTNRIDKPEYALSHVLNLIDAHEPFLRSEVQPLLAANGFREVDVVTDFISLLLPLLTKRLERHTPQLLELPPVLAHAVYQTLEFDAVLRERGYVPRGASEWKGISDTLLGRPAWFVKWLQGEKEFFDTRFYAAIGAADAWHVLAEVDYDVLTSSTSVRPSHSALRIAELSEQLAARYRPLPPMYALPFLTQLHLPLLASYEGRIAAALDAWETLSFGSMLPGAIGGEGRAAAGPGGAVRLLRAGVSARWMAEKCAEWADDEYFLDLLDWIKTARAEGELSDELFEATSPLVEGENGETVFDEPRRRFKALATRADELVVRHCVREVVTGLKAYIARRWDFTLAPDTPEEEALTPELLAPVSLLSTLFQNIASSLPPGPAGSLTRRVSSELSSSLYTRLLTTRTWSEAGGRQLVRDVEYGFLLASPSRQRRGWELLADCAALLALPGGEPPEGGIKFAKIVQTVFEDGRDDEYRELMDKLRVDLERKTAKEILRRRPECWR